jgi:hypothetical protein
MVDLSLGLEEFTQPSDRLGSATITQATPIRDGDQDDDFIGPRRVGHRDRDGVEMRE